jgi:hypothetical protein
MKKLTISTALILFTLVLNSQDLKKDNKKKLQSKRI